MAIDPTSGAVTLLGAAGVAGTSVLFAMDPGAAAFAITVVGAAFIGALALFGREFIKFMRDWRASQAGTVQEQLNRAQEQLREMTDRYEREAKARTETDANSQVKSDRLARAFAEIDKLRDQRDKDFEDRERAFEDRQKEQDDMHKKVIYMTDLLCSRLGLTTEPSDHVGHLMLINRKSEAPSHE